MNVAQESTNHTAQSVAHLQIQTYICAPEQDRLLLQNEKKKRWMPLKLLKKPPPTMVSHRVKLTDSRGRAWERKGERKRKQDGLSHHHQHLQLQHKILKVICNNIVTAFFSCSIVKAWVVNPGAASDNKFFWHVNPEANTAHELREKALFLSQKPKQYRCCILFHAARANTRHIFNIHLVETCLMNRTTAD